VVCGVEFMGYKFRKTCGSPECQYRNCLVRTTKAQKTEDFNVGEIWILDMEKEEWTEENRGAEQHEPQDIT